MLPHRSERLAGMSAFHNVIEGKLPLVPQVKSLSPLIKTDITNVPWCRPSF